MENTDRIDNLCNCLKYDSYGEKKLDDFDRMEIHKEISSIVGKRKYKVSNEVEQKITEILHLIERLNWESPY